MKYLPVVNTVLLAIICFGLFLVAQRLHEIDQDVDNCSDFLQIIGQNR